MQKKIKTALISVFDKSGLEPVIEILNSLQVKILSTGGTKKFIEEKGYTCISVESLTGYPSILGGRVKTLHPIIFGGMLARSEESKDAEEVKEYHIPLIDLVIVDLYPFEKTVASTNSEKEIIEKIDIGGPSMIRAAAKNFKEVLVVGNKNNYEELISLLKNSEGSSGLEDRRKFAAKAFDVCSGYDIAISNYFNQTSYPNPFSGIAHHLRYGENPHQQAWFHGDWEELFHPLGGKEISYNNLVDIGSALSLMSEFETGELVTFAIIKHTNVCGIAQRNNTFSAFQSALAGDPESAFGGILITNGKIDIATADALKSMFFEVLIAPDFEEEALNIIKEKKKRIILQLKKYPNQKSKVQSLLNGYLEQNIDEGNNSEWNEVGGKTSSEKQHSDLLFANLICKHLKSNAIAIIKDLQLLGKGCGQTSRVDAMRQAIEKARQFNQDLNGSVVASDAFFPFDDCVKIGHEAGVAAFIQPGGSIRDKDSINYCKNNDLVMVMTGMRHFRH